MKARFTLIDFLPRPSDYTGLRTSWRKDVIAGITVGVVALPLALAFGITTGLGATAGIVTAIVAGFVAAIFGGSNLQVSGPTGAMTVVLVPLVAQFGAGAIVTVSVLAGLLILVAGFLRLGRYLAFIPWPVVEGFTLGIATIIFLQQVPAALGVSKPHGQNDVVIASRSVVQALHHPHAAAVLIVAITVAVMVIALRLHRSLPASLLAVVAATITTVATGMDVSHIGDLSTSIPAPKLPSLDFADVQQYLGAAFAVAALAAIESLLSAKVADGMADSGRFDPDRELFGQGLANIASGFFGGMPATGAIARTAVNVRSGARTRLAAVVHSLTLIAVVAFGASLVVRVPLAALAGVLMVTAVRMIEVHNIRAILRSTRSDALVFVVTAIMTIAFDLVKAVEIGVVVAGVLALRHVARTSAVTFTPISLEVTADDERELLGEHIVAYRLDGAFFFGVAERFLSELASVSDVRVVILRLPGLNVLDATGANALKAIVEDLESRGITVLLKGPRVEHQRLLRVVGVLDQLETKDHIFDDLEKAIAHARYHASNGRCTQTTSAA